MFKKFGLLVVLFASAFLANAQNVTTALPGQRQFIPERIVFRTLFHTVNLLNEKANEADAQGRRDAAQNYRRAFRQDYELSDESTATLNRIAADYKAAVRDIDAQARVLLRERRRHYPNNALPAGQQPLAPSAELAALQQQRDLLATQYASRLREALGENQWRLFSNLVLVRVASGIQPTNSTRSAEKVRFVKTSVAKAQSGAQSVITGSTLISYNAYSNTVTSVSTTELDFAAQDYYTGRVFGALSDSNGNGTNASAYDTDADGTVSVTLQMPGEYDALTSSGDGRIYSARGTYGARVDIRDPAQGVRYMDYWNFQQVYAGGEGGYSYWIYMPFIGPGPLRYTNLRNLGLGSASPATIQVKPKVEVSKPTVSPATVTVNNSSATVSTTISATTNGLQTGDVAVIEVIDQNVNSPVTFINSPGQVITVTLDRGGTVGANFSISGISSPGTYSFRVYISDILRNGQSILNRVNVVNNNDSATITVNP